MGETPDAASPPSSAGAPPSAGAPTSARPAVPRGRRRGDAARTRERILAAARAEFASTGYDGVSLRAIARRAQVDPALVHHYFDGKQDVFAQALELPTHLPARAALVLEGPREAVGESIVRFFLEVWDAPGNAERMQAMMRGAVGSPEAGRQFREFIFREIIEPIARGTGVPDPARRAGVAAAQLVGLALFRYVVPHPPLAEATHEELVALIAPTLQRYLVDRRP